MDFLDDIPDDSELAFLYLEKNFREQRRKAQDNGHQNYDPTEDDIRYMSRTLAARTELGLGVLDDWKLPSANDNTEYVVQNFLRDVDHYRTILEIRHSKRNKGLTVRFDAAAKSKLRHYATQIKELLDQLEIEEWKREYLRKAILDFEAEIERDRSRLAVFGDLVVKCGGVFGEAAERAEPARKWIDSIARLIWGEEMKERAERLPPPTPKREIPPPPKQIPGPKSPARTKKQKDMDDEIPF